MVGLKNILMYAEVLRDVPGGDGSWGKKKKGEGEKGGQRVIGGKKKIGGERRGKKELPVACLR